jgi:hypothetical protein
MIARYDLVVHSLPHEVRPAVGFLKGTPVGAGSRYAPFPMPTRSRARAWATTLPLSAALVACSAIWGFQEGVLGNPDGGIPEATPDAVPDGGEDAMSRDTGCAPPTQTCEPVAPSGWSGPYEISEVSGSSPTACGANYPNQKIVAGASPNAPPASCDCSCGEAVGSGCAAPTLTLYNNSPCDDASLCKTVDASTESCLDLDPMCGGAHMSLSAPTPIVGSCAPMGKTSVVDAGWETTLGVCGTATPPAYVKGICEPEQVCVPVLDGVPFGGTYCIASTGNNSCPAGPYSEKKVYYRSGTDTRGCTACDCKPPNVTCTNGVVATFNNTGCPSPPHNTFMASTACMPIGGDKSALFIDAEVSSGPCAPTGGAPTGAFMPMNPVTICCEPAP